MKDNLPIAIDLGSRGIKVAQVLTRAGRPIEARCGFDAYAEGAAWRLEEDLGAAGEALSGAMQQAGVKGKRAICVLPRRLVTLRFTEFPPARPEEASRMAEIEAQQHIPLPAEDTIVGYEVLARAQDNLRPAVVAAARKEVVESCYTLLSAAGLQPEQITLDALCLFRLWQSQVGGEESVLLLDIGAGVTVVNLLENGLLRLSRAVPYGGEILTEAFAEDMRLPSEEAEIAKHESGLRALEIEKSPRVAAWLDGIAAEIRRSMLAHRAGAARPTKAFLTGGGSLLAGLTEALKERTGLEAAPLPLGQSIMASSQAPIFMLPMAAGLQASASEERLNLVLPAAIAREAARLKRRTWQAAAIALVVAILTFVAGTFGLLQQRKAEYAALQEEHAESRRIMAQSKQLTDQRKALGSQIRYMAGIEMSRHLFLDLLLEIHLQAPEKVWLTSLVLEKAPAGKNGEEAKETIVRLQTTGHAPDNEAVADLVSALARVDGMKRVNLQSAKPSRFGDRHIVEFSLACELSPATSRQTPTDPQIEEQAAL